MNTHLKNGYHHYHELNVMLASPERLIVILYEEMICSVSAAKTAFLAKDHKMSSKHLFKGVDILLELIGALNMEKGGEVAISLAEFYQMIVKKLFILYSEPTLERFDEVLRLVVPMKEAWGAIATAPAAVLPS
ncbi:MAG: flagellar export chaperone FliS [Nitrospirota bacterium]